MKTTSIISLLLVTATTVLGNPFPLGERGVCTQCVPSPNNCDITAPCASFVNKLYCACRPGYKAGQYSNSDATKQWRIDTLRGHEHRVWVAPGVVCDTLCDNPWGILPCAEVAVANTCAPVI
jgi:hypothetical protein